MPYAFDYQDTTVRKARQQANRPSGARARPSHLKALADARGAMPRVRVEPAKPEYRDTLRHPNGMAFRREGSVEWPFDRFTQRRLREGSIRIVEHAEATQGRVARRHETARKE